MSSNTTVDDVDSHVVYSTTPAWNTGVWSGQEPQPLFGTNHGSPNPGAVATFTFTGTAVYVYGYKASDHGYRDVSIAPVHSYSWIPQSNYMLKNTTDGASPVTCDGRAGSQGSRALVYWAEGLSQGTHDITLKHTGIQGQYLNIDYFLVTNIGGGDSTATITGNNPAYNSTQNNNQSSSSIGIIVGVVVAAAVVSLLAVVWFLWRRRRKARLHSEKGSRADLDGGTTREPQPMPVMAGTTPDPRVIEPFYAPLPNPGKVHPNATPMFNSQNRQPYPESSSGYYSHSGPQSTRSSAPSGYSPPPNQAQFAPLHLHAPSTTAGTSTYASSTTAEVGSAPWATSTLGETASGTSRKRAADPSISKARYSGANSLGASSTSRPLSPPTIDDSVPPPQYEL